MSTIELVDPGRVRMHVELPPDEAAQGVEPGGGLDLSTVRGCRIPFRTIDRRAGAVVLPKALEDLVLAQVLAAAGEHRVRLVGRPTVDILECGPGRPLRFTADLEVRQPVVLPDLSTITVTAQAADRDAQLRDQVIARLIADVPAPAAAVRDQVEQRKQWLIGELHRAGTALREHLEAQGMTEAQLDADLLAATADRVRAQVVLDDFADAEELEVTQDELHDELTARARGAGVSAQLFADTLVRKGALPQVVADLRREAALALIMRRVHITEPEHSQGDSAP